MEKLFRDHAFKITKLFHHRKGDMLTVHWKLTGDIAQHEALIKDLFKNKELDVSQS